MVKRFNPFKRMSTGDIIIHLVISVIMVFVVVVTLYPFYYIAIASISDAFELSKKIGIMLLPQGLNLAAYNEVFKYALIWTAYGNTIIYVVCGTAINLALTVTAAFALSRRGLKGSSLIMKLIVFTMFFNGGMVPTYVVVDSLGMVNTRWAMLIPLAINAYNFIILRTAFSAVPVEMEEAVTIDGGNYLHVFRHVIIPLALPSIMVIGLYYAVGHWNTYFSALLYLRSNRLYPLQIVLRNILIQSGGDQMAGDSTFASQYLAQTVKYAVIMVATIPIIMVYPFIQKYFVKGIMIGSIKG